MSSIAFDTTALIHFSRAGRLTELRVSSTEGILDRATTEGTVSDLLTTGMRLPFKKGTDFIP